MKSSSSEGMTQTERLRHSYDTVYESEKTGIQELNLDRWPRNRWEALVHGMPSHAGNVLEIGCGNGVVLYHIADRCEAITGVDISGNRCEVARANLVALRTPVEIIQGNLEEGLQKPDGSYDLILWADVIEHVVDVFASMREVVRLLAPGGTLITSTPNIAYIRYRVALLVGKFPGTAAQDEGFAVRPGEMYDGGHLHYFTVGVMKALYKMNGLRVSKVEGFGRLGRFHSIAPSLLSGAVQIIGVKE